MLRLTLIALAAATLLGTAGASAAPMNGSGIAAAAQANGPVENVWYRYHRHYRPVYFYRRHHHHRWW